MATTKSKWVLSELGAARRWKASTAFWADKPISQMLDTAHRNKQFCEVNTNFAPNSDVSQMMNEWMNEKRAAERTVPTVTMRDDSNAQRYETISSILTKRSFGGCCRAELVKAVLFQFLGRLCSHFETKRPRVPMGSSRGHLSLASSPWLLNCCVHTERTETTQKRPLVSEHQAYKHNNFLKFLNFIYFFSLFLKFLLLGFQVYSKQNNTGTI